jgi:DNA-binding LacI/PurR family transcriptional regulator
MHDVAKLAGVSHQTVSRVINGGSNVRPQTRERVLAAMDMLDYRPNSAARALATGRTRTLGVIAFDTALYGPASTLVGVERAAHAAGYFVSIVSLDALDARAVMRAIERLQAVGVDGILTIAPQLSSLGASWILPDDLPVVAVEAGPPTGIPVAHVDQYEGARLATEHLLSLGHAAVHHLGGPRDWIEAEQRIEGWNDALDAAGATGRMPVRGDWSARSGYEAGRELLTLPDLTAVFVANDQMALGFLRALHEHGCQVPDDISVVGFDDIPEAAFFTPPLTTVRQDFTEMGRRGLQLLLQRLDGGPSEARAIVPASLSVRSSTRAPSG